MDEINDTDKSTTERESAKKQSDEPKEAKVDESVEEKKSTKELVDDDDEVVVEKKPSVAIPDVDTDQSAAAAAEAANVQPKQIQQLQQQQQPKKHLSYSVKWIRFGDRQTPIIMQNENGPCPLLSICNVLLLRDQLKFPPETENISGDSLINTVADTLLHKFLPSMKQSMINRNEESSARWANLEKNIDDALQILADLELGLDVNVKFDKPNSFEYTKEMCIFDVFNIGLFHGWLVDPQQTDLYQLIGHLSYNQVLDKMISMKGDQGTGAENEPPATTTKDLFLIEDFLDATAWQLTYQGLAELHQLMKPGQLGVFFRNNHFSTIYKSPVDEQLYTLVTDSGFLGRRRVVWETLSTVDGDERFVDSNFKNYNKEKDADDSNSSQNEDYKLALELERNENDEKVARLLQEEEDRREEELRREEQRAAHQQQQQQQRSNQSGTRDQQQQQQQQSSSSSSSIKSKIKDCQIS